MLDVHARNHVSRVRRETNGTSSSLSLVRFRRVQMERRQCKQRFHRRQEQVPVVTLKRKTHLVAFLFVICQYAMVDRQCILPVGIISWFCSFTVAMELLAVATARHKHQEEYILKAQELYMKERYEAALFEYQVLRKSNKRIVMLRENGRPSAIVAID